MSDPANNFSLCLIDWFSREKRPLPWRENKDPYRVWLSEIILQQTRVVQGTPYYLRFVEAFPKVEDLASASEQEVLKLWEGLGYYSRARNLHTAAKQVSERMGGQFPNNYKELLNLKGVGPYTAAAIATICYEEQVPVIDGNVFRVISRVFGISEDIANPSSRKVFEQTLIEIMPNKFVGDFSQSLMELGALICTPASPSCDNCPVADFCFAYQNKQQSNFPVKNKKIKVQKRFMHYHIYMRDGKFALRERQSGDIWQGLWDFYMEETPENVEIKISTGHTTHVSDVIKHVLTHRQLFVRFYHVAVSDREAEELRNNYGLTFLSMDELITLPKPKLIVNYLTQLNN